MNKKTKEKTEKNLAFLRPDRRLETDNTFECKHNISHHLESKSPETFFKEI